MGFKTKVSKVFKHPTTKNALEVARGTANYTGVVPLARQMKHWGPYGNVLSTALFGHVPYSMDVAQGKQKFSFRGAHRQSSPYETYQDDKYNLSREAAAPAEEQAAAARAAELEQENTIAGRVANLNASYGIGDSENAHANADRLNGLFDKTATAWRQGQMDNLQGTFGSALRANRFHQADAGTIGSGMDAQAQTGNLAGWLQGMNDVNEKANGVRGQLQDTLDTQRRGLEGQIRAGTMVDMNGLNALNGQKVALDQATANIPQVALGNLFTQAGQVYSSGNQAGAYGYRGFGGGGGLFSRNGSGATSSRGSIG